MNEVRAAQFAGTAEFMGDAGADEGGHGFVERFAEFDRLEALRFPVDTGQGEGLREASDGGEKWHPIDPAGKGALPLCRRRKQEVPVLGADVNAG